MRKPQPRRQPIHRQPTEGELVATAIYVLQQNLHRAASMRQGRVPGSDLVNPLDLFSEN